MSSLECIVVTPESTVRDSSAEFVVLPLYDGEIGIAPGHAPLIGRLGYGEMRINAGGRTERYYVGGGFVQVHDNLVAVLTDQVIPAEELDPAVARERLAAATSRTAVGSERIAQREVAQKQARAMLRVAERTHH